jgi:hypothetical protein
MAAAPTHFAAFKALAVALGRKSRFAPDQCLFSTSLTHSGEVTLELENRFNYHPIKTNILKALELNPKDSASLHILGIWHFNVANLGFLARYYVKVR